MKRFPDFKTLASAPLSQILMEWQGMGYNRRALYLKQAAQNVMKNYNGNLPHSPTILKTFPGIGAATAASIVVFSWNKPLIFIETNIRRVFIHHFFKNSQNVDDKELLPLIEKTLDQKNPRQWYWALMDYGSNLTKQTMNPNRISKHYTKQSQFKGSDRQVRGKILQLLLQKRPLTDLNSVYGLKVSPNRLNKIATIMIKEGLIEMKRNKYQLV